MKQVLPVMNNIMLKVCIIIVMLCSLIKGERIIRNLNVETLVDISSFIVKDKHKINFINIGNDMVNSYIFDMQESEPYVIKFHNNNQSKLSYKTKNIGKTTRYVVTLDQPVHPEKEYVLRVSSVYSRKIVPGFKTSKYNEKHDFLWKGNIQFYSPYQTEASKFVFLSDHHFNRNLEVSVMFQAAIKDMHIYYFRNIKPYSYKEMHIRFTSDVPMLIIKKLNRMIAVSHYGKILIQDNVVLENAGPKLVGPYETTPYRQYWLYTHLPASAESIKFFDILGNNSKTELLLSDTEKTIKFAPRYPILQGGWRTAYSLQYYVPIFEYLFTNEAYFYLHIRAVDHILNDVVIEDAMVNILLPDGATVSELKLPDGLYQVKSVKQFTSLGFSGRQGIRLMGRSLLEDHIAPVTIKYSYPWYNLWTAPLFITIMLQCIFLFIICWRRFGVYITLPK